MMKIYNNYLFFISFLVFIGSAQSYSQTVSTNSELQAAITNASAGSTITLTNGTWTDVDISINKEGTIDDPITIEAETPGEVFFEGDSHIKLGGSFVIFKDVVFQNPSNLSGSGDDLDPIIEFRTSSSNLCNDCTVTNVKIDSYNGTESQKELTFKWVLVHGQNNEISYCSFIGKYGVGSIINDNRNNSDADFTKIHHNYFAERTPINEFNEDNDQDAIRIGNSSTSLSDSFTEVYDNFFYDFSGEIEVISNKSGQNKYYNNTFRDYQGTLTLRHGDNCEVYNNFFFAENNLFTGGIRVIGEGHKIYNNYIEGVNSIKPDGSRTSTAGAINVSNGRPNSALNGYFQVKDVTITNNTFVNGDYGFRIGTNVGGDLSLAPENLVIANNIMINTDRNAVDEQTAPTGSISIYEGNITQDGSWDLVTGTNNNREVTSGLLINGENFYELASGSAAIDAGVGTYDFLTEDILGGSRPSAFDAGAQEFGSAGTRLPYTTADVGVTVGFGALAVSDPRLVLNPGTISVGREAGSIEFTVKANVDWIITDDVDWLSLDVSSGSNSTVITATYTENTGNSDRSGTITISEVTGGNDLSDTITFTQTDEFTPEEITIVGATAIGTEPGKPNVAPEFAWDDNVTSAEYWTGDANTEDEVSITFDLSCVHVLSQIGLHILKADERTINFDISIAEEEDGPFTNVLTGQNSTIVSGGVDQEQLFDISREVARYIKFTSNGNSEGSGFASIAEVNIYGDPECGGTLGINENLFDVDDITLYPNPAKDGFFNITSEKEIGWVRIFDMTGRKVMETYMATDSGKISVKELQVGSYFIQTTNSKDNRPVSTIILIE